MMTRDTAIQQLIADAATFYQHGWMLGTSGNLSICTSKDPLEYVITASGQDKGRLTTPDFVTLTAGLTPIDNNQPKPSAETALHEMLYTQLPECWAVYHVHSSSATALSMRTTGNALLFSGLEMLKGLGLETHQAEVILPIYENTQDIVGLARDLSPTLDASVPGFMLRGHGLYTWGKSAFDAKQRLECWNFLFDVALKMPQKDDFTGIC